MELSELILYAEEKYQMLEKRNQADPHGISTLCHPKTGGVIARLMREWNGDIGEFIERCDIKCGQNRGEMSLNPFLSAPFREKGPNWVGVIFDSKTDKELVLNLFDRAVRSEEKQNAFTIVFASQLSSTQNAYHDTPINLQHFDDTDVPEQIRRMLSLYEYGDDSHEQRCLNFYRQGKMMEHYEDNVPWKGEFRRFFPTYHDMNIPQLRGYFTWRTQIRKGEWQKTSVSMAYIYIYELLNGIGVASPEESIEKMLEFEQKYVYSEIGEKYMGRLLRRWMLEFAVINNLPAERAMECADSEMAKLDNALVALRIPEKHNDLDVVNALCFFSEQKTPIPDVVIHLVAETWRYALKNCNIDGNDLFTICFGEVREYMWEPLGNAVYYKRMPEEDTEYKLNECRWFQRRKGLWFEFSHKIYYFNRRLVCAFLHQTDLCIRRYLKTGNYLRRKSGEEWVLPYVNAVISEDKRLREEAARPKIDIHLEHLEHIREDAIKTRDSLLTEEELEDIAPVACESVKITDVSVPESDSKLPIERKILHLLLNGESPSELMKTNRLMPSVIADAINEAFFDEIGDNIVECDNDCLTLVEDYNEDVRKLIDK